jgi:hypothetical protein
LLRDIGQVRRESRRIELHPNVRLAASPALRSVEPSLISVELVRRTTRRRLGVLPA